MPTKAAGEARTLQFQRLPAVLRSGPKNECRSYTSGLVADAVPPDSEGCHASCLRSGENEHLGSIIIHACALLGSSSVYMFAALGSEPRGFWGVTNCLQMRV